MCDCGYCRLANYVKHLRDAQLVELEAQREAIMEGVALMAKLAAPRREVRRMQHRLEEQSERVANVTRELEAAEHDLDFSVRVDAYSRVYQKEFVS